MLSDAACDDAGAAAKDFTHFWHVRFGMKVSQALKNRLAPWLESFKVKVAEVRSFAYDHPFYPLPSTIDVMEIDSTTLDMLLPLLLESMELHPNHESLR